jgi:YD repeat-containing protein
MLQPGSGDTGTFAFTRIFPMFGSAQAFIGFLAGLIPCPSPMPASTSHPPPPPSATPPWGMMIPMGAKSCSDIPIMPNAAVVGFSNVLTGMSIGDFLGPRLECHQRRRHGGIPGRPQGRQCHRPRIAKSNNPRLQNAAQRVNDFVGGDNCIAEGHPVDVVSGTVFTEATDFTLFSAQDLVFRRFYNSRAEHLPTDPSGFGPGWRHDFDEVLIADEATDGVRTLALRNREGRILGFDLPLVDGGTDFHPGERLTLTRIDGRTWEVRDINDTVRVFEFAGEGKAPPSYQPPPGKQARLAAVRTPEGGAGHRFYWEKNRLTGFADAAGRVVQVKQDHQGRIAELRLIQSGGQDCDIFLAGYRYDGDGRLIAHIDRNRNLRWYRYDAQNRLIRETDRNGYSFHFHYDAQGRCSHTYGDDNAFWCPTAAPPS